MPAHYAATYGHNNIIALLAERDPASLMIQDNVGDTPAHDATAVCAQLCTDIHVVKKECGETRRALTSDAKFLIKVFVCVRVCV